MPTLANLVLTFALTLSGGDLGKVASHCGQLMDSCALGCMLGADDDAENAFSCLAAQCPAGIALIDCAWDSVEE